MNNDPRNNVKFDKPLHFDLESILDPNLDLLKKHNLIAELIHSSVSVPADLVKETIEYFRNSDNANLEKAAEISLDAKEILLAKDIYSQLCDDAVKNKDFREAFRLANKGELTYLTSDIQEKLISDNESMKELLSKFHSLNNLQLIPIYLDLGFIDVALNYVTKEYSRGYYNQNLVAFFSKFLSSSKNTVTNTKIIDFFKKDYSNCLDEVLRNSNNLDILLDTYLKNNDFKSALDIAKKQKDTSKIEKYAKLVITNEIKTYSNSAYDSNLDFALQIAADNNIIDYTIDELIAGKRFVPALNFSEKYGSEKSKKISALNVLTNLIETDKADRFNNAYANLNSTSAMIVIAKKHNLQSELMDLLKNKTYSYVADVAVKVGLYDLAVDKYLGSNDLINAFNCAIAGNLTDRSKNIGEMIIRKQSITYDALLDVAQKSGNGGLLVDIILEKKDIDNLIIAIETSKKLNLNDKITEIMDSEKSYFDKMQNFNRVKSIITAIGLDDSTHNLYESALNKFKEINEYKKAGDFANDFKKVDDAIDCYLKVDVMFACDYASKVDRKGRAKEILLNFMKQNETENNLGLAFEISRRLDDVYKTTSIADTLIRDYRTSEEYIKAVNIAKLTQDSVKNSNLNSAEKDLMLKEYRTKELRILVDSNDYVNAAHRYYELGGSTDNRDWLNDAIKFYDILASSDKKQGKYYEKLSKAIRKEYSL